MKSISDDFEIYKFKISNWQYKKDKIIELFYNTNPRVYGNVFTNFNTNEESRIFLNKEVTKIFGDTIEQFIADVNEPNYCVNSSWMQIYKKDMYHEIHEHGLGYSAIIYIKYDSKIHSSTVFVDGKTMDDTKKIFKPKVEEGDIIFFNSKHNHYCPSNENDKERMICSFNLKKKLSFSYS